MGFRQEINEQYEKEQLDKLNREKEIEILKKHSSESNYNLDNITIDEILNPDNYDDFGYPRHYTS